MTSDQVKLKMSNAYAASGGTKALPWAEIIKIILSLFGGCSTTAAVKRWVGIHPIAAEALLVSKLRNNDSLAISKKDADAIAAAGLKVFNSTSAADIDSLRD